MPQIELLKIHTHAGVEHGAGAVIDVDMSEIEPGNARVRLINLSPDAGEVV